MKLYQAIVLSFLSMVGVMLTSEEGWAQEASWHGFAKSEYLLKGGGTPPSLAEMAAHENGPQHFFRHENAYQAFKGGFESMLKRELSDAVFVQLLGGDDVRDTTTCVGHITTNRINGAGTISTFNRPCRLGEKLIEVRVGDDWHIVASQGCLNQVFKVYSPRVKPTAKPKSLPRLEVTNGGMLPRRQVIITSPGLYVPKCNCGKGTWLPGTSVMIPRSN